MKALITGAAGFIGSQLAYKLWKEGYEVVLIDNFSYGKEDNLIFPDKDFRDEILRMDIRDDLNELFKTNNFDYVYNIAGIAPLPDCQSDPCEAVSVNVNGFVNILEMSRQYGVKTVVQASTNAMYENELAFPTSEKHFTPPTLIYPNTKYCAERFAQSYADTYGMNVCCVRFANVYGPHIDCLRKQPPFVAYMIRELYYDRTPEFFSNGTQSRDYIYVDDLTDLLIKVQACEGFDAVNCSSGRAYSVQQLYKIASDVMGKDIKAHYNDSSKYWEKYPALYEGAYRIKDEILEHEVNKYSLCSNKHAYDVYDWQPKVSIENGLRKVIESEVELLSQL